MMNLLRIGVHCAAALAVVVSSSGCSSSTSGGSKNGTGPVDSGTGSPDASKTVTLDAHVLDFPNTQTALADVKVCIYPALTECATSDQTGHVTLAVPANSEVAISFDATSAGHTRLLAPLTTHASDITGRAWSITSAATAQSIAQAAGFTIDPAKGSIIGQASAPSAGLGGSTGATAGVALALTPASGKGPIYFGASGTPDPTLTATSAAGFGLGIFGGVAPGDYELGFSGKTCVVSDVAAWKGTSPSSVHAPVAAGYLTLAGMDCQ